MRLLPVMRRRSLMAFTACSAALLVPANADAARKKAPELTRIRCVPATSATCKSGVKVVVGRQLQISGKRVTKGMRVAFRWSRGALATKLDRSRVGYVARVPAGVDFGAPDGPATLIFLIAAPASGDSDHLKILASLARRLVHESFRTSLREAPDAATVAEIVTREVNPS